MTDRMTPAELAAFDQAWQQRNREIDAVLAVYRDTLAAFPGMPEGQATLAAVLHDRFNHDDLADMVACAVARIATLTPDRRTA